jgi:hypothetical protein
VLSGVPIGAAYALVVPGGFAACTAGDQDGSGNGRRVRSHPPVRRWAFKLGSCVADTAFKAAFATVRATSSADTRDEKRPRMKRGQHTKRGLLADANSSPVAIERARACTHKARSHVRYRGKAENICSVCVPMAVAARLPGCRHQPLDLGRRKVLAGAN